MHLSRAYNEPMPEIETDTSANIDPLDSSELARRLAEVEAERDELRTAIDSQANASLASWMVVVNTEARILRDMQNTLSWRVTKPLRRMRELQLKVARVGVARASQLAVADFRRRFLGRRR